MLAEPEEIESSKTRVLETLRRTHRLRFFFLKFNIGWSAGNRTRIGEFTVPYIFVCCNKSYSDLGFCNLVSKPDQLVAPLGIEPRSPVLQTGALTDFAREPFDLILVRQPGVEPGTYGLEIRYSIQLSYRRILFYEFHTLYPSSLRVLIILQIVPNRFLPVSSHQSNPLSKAL